MAGAGICGFATAAAETVVAAGMVVVVLLWLFQSISADFVRGLR